MCTYSIEIKNTDYHSGTHSALMIYTSKHSFASCRKTRVVPFTAQNVPCIGTSTETLLTTYCAISLTSQTPFRSADQLFRGPDPLPESGSRDCASVCVDWEWEWN